MFGKRSKRLTWQETREHLIKDEAVKVAKYVTECTTQMNGEYEVVAFMTAELLKFSVGKLDETNVSSFSRQVFKVLRAHCTGGHACMKEKETRCMAAYVSIHLSRYLADLLLISAAPSADVGD